MANKVGKGSVLTEEGPESGGWFESEPYPRLFYGCGLQRRIRKAGRSFFCVVLSNTLQTKGGSNDRQNQNGDYPDPGRRALARLLAVRKRALFEGLEISQKSRWLRTGSKNPPSGMDLFLHGG